MLSPEITEEKLIRCDLKVKFSILRQHRPQKAPADVGPYPTIEEIDELPIEELLARYERNIEAIRQEEQLDKFRANYITLNMVLEMSYTDIFGDASKSGMTVRELAIPITTLEEANIRLRNTMAQLDHDYQAFITNRIIDADHSKREFQDAILSGVRSMLDGYAHGTELPELLNLLLNIMIDQYRGIGNEGAWLFELLKGHGSKDATQCNLI